MNTPSQMTVAVRPDRTWLARFGVVALCLLGMVADGTAAPAPAPASPPASPPWTALEDQLRIALQGPDTAAVRVLVNAGANPNARDVLGGKALHVAANMRGDVEVQTLLLDQGADLLAVNPDGQTPLMMALRHAHYKHEGQGQQLVQVARLLLSRGASVKATGPNTPGAPWPLRAAMDPVNLPLIQLLLQHGAALPDDSLDWALSNQQVYLVRLLMPRATPAMLAFRDPSVGTLLHRAAASPDTGFAIGWLLAKGLHIHATDQDGITPIGRAAFAGNLAGVVQLHKAKARLDTVDHDGQTLLHLAAYGAHDDVMQWLVAHGLDIRARDQQASTALGIALDTHTFAYFTEPRKLALIKLLDGVPGDLQRGRFSDHPLHAAVSQRDIQAVERLLAAGVSPNLKDASGNTPLYWAIVESSPLLTTPSQRAWGSKLLPLLIRHGADTTMKPGGEVDKTYDQLAREMRVTDLMDRAKARHAAR